MLVHLIAVMQAPQRAAGNSSDGTTSISYGLGGYHRGRFCRTYSDTKGNAILGSGC